MAARRLTHGIGARWHSVRRRYKWWQLTLFVIGVVAAVSVTSALFFAVGHRPIYFAAPYYIPDTYLQEALVTKARGGLDVRLLLPGPRTDNWIVRASAQARYQELLAAGVKIYEYEPTFMHAKYGVIDGKWSIICSPNLNSRSRELDEENALGIYDEALGAKLKATFMQDLNRAKRIDLEEWRQRNPLRKFSETISRILDQQS